MGAKIFIIEDKEEIRGLIRLSLEEEGHTVLFEAITRKEALEKIKEAKEAGVDVAIVDGSLGTSTYRGEDGYEISQAIRKEAPGIKIIAFSADRMEWGHYNLVKPNDREKLVDIVNQISLQQIRR